MYYKALDIAEYIVGVCSENKYGISNLKLQKILYFVQAEFLTVRRRACFQDIIEAWDFGPVVPNVYRFYKAYGSGNIPVEYKVSQIRINKDDKELIDNVVRACNKYSATQLVRITHNQEPWIKAYKKYQNNEITTKSIERFFGE